MPLAAESEKFKDFIETYWRDLNALSRDYLDIYYCKEDYGRSGHEMSDMMRHLPGEISNHLPCLVLWDDNMANARKVVISGLENKEIYQLFETIIQCIQSKSTMEDIITMANEYTEKCEQDKKSINNITTNVNSNSGFITGIINGNINGMTVNNTMGLNNFINEADIAIQRIQNFEKLDKQFKKALIQIISEAKDAFGMNSDDKKQQCQKNFNYFVQGAGKRIKKVLSTLGDLASLASFFGISFP